MGPYRIGDLRRSGAMMLSDARQRFRYFVHQRASARQRLHAGAFERPPFCNVDRLRRAYRQLVQHNTSRALELIERDPALQTPEVAYLVQFITSARRGVILRRPSRKLDDAADAD